jgi:hypothetical protein
MPKPSASPTRKKRTDKLDWEELEKAPNVEGMLSYLRVPSQSATQNNVAGKSFDLDQRHAAVTSSEATHSEESAISQNFHSPKAGERIPTIPHEPGLQVPLQPQSVRVHRCVYVQDAHTSGEQVLLTTLTRLGKHPRYGRAEKDGACIVSVSTKELAVQAAMHESNVRLNLRSLLKKLAIELVEYEDKKKQTARVYRVLPFKQILERRRAAGMLYVIKSHGIKFITKDETDSLLASESLGSVLRNRSWSLASETLPGAGSESLGSLAKGCRKTSIL